jgi:redox-regulated HSP33 family molecular chaperone
MKTNTLIQLLLFAVLMISILACEEKKAGIPAPLDDIATLEKLATAYTEVSEQIPVSPVKLAPQARRKFIEQVFTTAGFDYLQTLKSLSEVQRDNITKSHRDLQELLFLPHHGLQQQAMKEIYSEKELTLVAKIETNFK